MGKVGDNRHISCASKRRSDIKGKLQCEGQRASSGNGKSKRKMPSIRNRTSKGAVGLQSTSNRYMAKKRKSSRTSSRTGMADRSTRVSVSAIVIMGNG